MTYNVLTRTLSPYSLYPSRSRFFRTRQHRSLDAFFVFVTIPTSSFTSLLPFLSLPIPLFPPLYWKFGIVTLRNHNFKCSYVYFDAFEHNSIDSLLPPPRKLCFSSVCLFICLFVITTITGKVVDRFWQKFLYGWDVWLYRKTELDFRYDPDHDTGIFTGILTIAGWDNSTNFADNSRICRRNSYDFFKDRMSHWQQIIGAETGGREDNVPNNLVGVRHSECPLSQYFARLSCISVH